MADDINNDKSIVVVGALAYDQIAATPNTFSAQGPSLNCKLDSLEKHFGGCGGNIVYGIGSLKHSTKLISICGELDAQLYRTQLASPFIDLRGVMTKLNAHCARAFIISDPNGEQFIAFYPGPEVTHDSWEAHLNSQDIASSQIVICAPFPQRFMVSSLHYMTRVNPKALRIWSPGQYADSLDAGAVEELSPLWDVLIGNEYEVEYLVSIDPKLMNKKTVVVTAGPRPIRVYMAHGGTRTFPVINMTDASADPTGAGDAFVAGFAVTVSQHISLENKGAWIGHINEAVKNGVRSAQRCLAHVGSQNYHRSKT